LGEPGQAEEIDFRNINLGGTAWVDVRDILGGSGQPEATSENFVAASATVGAHELGHLAGLRHADAFGPLGFGIHAPPGAAEFEPFYPGPVSAFETTGTVIASPGSVGSSLADTLNLPYFNERSAVKLAFNEFGSVVDEVSHPHGTPLSAQPLALNGLFVPNTLPAGLNLGKVFAVEAVAVVSSLSQPDERDVYEFSGQANDLFNFEIMSRSLARYRTDFVNSRLRVLNEAGEALAFFDGVAENDDPFENVDPLLVDFRLPHDGKFYIELAATPSQPDDTGSYELFVYRFDAGNSSDGGDHLVGLAGNDYLRGGMGDDLLDGGPGDDVAEGAAGNDTFVMVPGSDDQVLELFHPDGGIDTLDFTGAQAGITIDLAISDGTPQQVDALFNTVALRGSLENLLGSPFADILLGNELDNFIRAGRGNDQLFGRDGNDTFTSDEGSDLVDGGRGIDRLVEQRNSDFTLSDKWLKVARETDTLRSIEQAELTGGVSDNKINASAFSGPVVLWGLDGADHLQGGGNNDILHGGSGPDKLSGGKGNDVLVGDAGQDDLGGGPGRDLLIGGDGFDRQVGGEGDDLLIGGRTSYDDNDAALRTLIEDWSLSDPYRVRVDRLRLLLNADTVFDDPAADRLTGSADEDWFLAFAGDITDRKPAEIIDDV
jgi:Ca2+-binding RTX toxin-like protein